MKGNKKYVVASLCTQMIIIPVVLTLEIFIIMGVLSNGLNLGNQGKYTTDLIYLIIFSFSALITGTVVGMFFSRGWKNKDVGLKEKYKILLFPIIYTLVFAIAILMFSGENYNSIWWRVYIFKNPSLIIFDFIVALMGFNFFIPVGEILAHVGFAFGILIYEVVSKKEVKTSVPKRLKVISTILIISTVVVLSGFTKAVISNGYIELVYGETTLKNDLTEGDLLELAPFRKDNGLAKLDKPASLEFSDINTMPRLDGATAAYPVYASFAEAVYTGLGEYYFKAIASSTYEFKDKDIHTAFVGNENFPFNVVKCSKTELAYDRLINGQTDIIFVAEPSKAHMEKVKAYGEEFVLTPIGSEAFVFFTNKENSVENLTVKQIQDIYSGSIKNWKEVGGENKSIQPYQRPENSGSQTVMQNKVMKNVAMLEPTKETLAGGMGNIINRVASYKNAKNSIGYSFMYYASEMFKNNQIKYVAIEGVTPTKETVKSNTYPFTVPVYAVTLKSNKNENVDKFIQWILSVEGQKLVEKTGYVPVN